MFQAPFSGIISGIKYKYDIILCKPNREELMFLQYSNLIYNPTFNEYNQLTITINRLIGDIDGTVKINESWNKIKHDYLIHLRIKQGNEILYREYFVIENPELSGEDVDIQTFSCSSYEKNDFNNKNLEGFSGIVRKLYDPNWTLDENGIEYGIMNYICRYKLYNTWSIGHVDNSLLLLERVLTFSGQSLTSVLTSLGESCKCIFIFDNINKKINIYESKVGMLGENKGLIITSKNYIRDIKYIEDTTGIRTRLFMIGKDNSVIARYNPTGQRYVDNFSYYLDNGYFSDSLVTALNKYNALIESRRGVFEGYVNRLDAGDTSVIPLIDSLKNSLLWENNFTQAQINELVPFIKEETKQIPQISDARQLYDYAVKHLKTICFIPIQISISSIDIFELEKYQLDWNKLTKIGDFCNIYYEEFDLIFKEMRLISYTHNPVENTLNLEFSNVDEYITKQWDDFVFILDTKDTNSINTYNIEGASHDLSYVDSSISLINNDIDNLTKRVEKLEG